MKLRLRPFLEWLQDTGSTQLLKAVRKFSVYLGPGEKLQKISPFLLTCVRYTIPYLASIMKKPKVKKIKLETSKNTGL